MIWAGPYWKWLLPIIVWFDLNHSVLIVKKKYDTAVDAAKLSKIVFKCEWSALSSRRFQFKRIFSLSKPSRGSNPRISFLIRNEKGTKKRYFRVHFWKFVHLGCNFFNCQKPQSSCNFIKISILVQNYWKKFLRPN